MLLIKNVETYTPKFIGVKDILIGGEQILLIKDEINITNEHIKIINGQGKMIVPGFIDSHVHILGGGGEGGFKTRTPEIKLSDMITAGVTTVVGCLGTDGISRSSESLIAKAKALKEEGVTAYVYIGSYRVPIQTLTDSLMKDLMMIEEIIGVGEVAIADHRSSQPTVEEFKKMTADARTAGILSNKAGIINVHLGDGIRGLELLNAIVDTTEIPISQFLPTHINRNQRLFKEGLAFINKGGFVDFTTSTTKKFIKEGEIKASLAVKKVLDKELNGNNITLSSDGQGSLPSFDENGFIDGLEVGTSMSLYQSFIEMVKDYGIDMEQALKTITKNPANILKLKNKGEIKENNDADLVILDQAFEICHVIARGQHMMKNKKVLKKGTFE